MLFQSGQSCINYLLDANHQQTDAAVPAVRSRNNPIAPALTERTYAGQSEGTIEDVRGDDTGQGEEIHNVAYNATDDAWLLSLVAQRPRLT